jgi:hypothetical protein
MKAGLSGRASYPSPYPTDTVKWAGWVDCTKNLHYSVGIPVTVGGTALGSVFVSAPGTI